MIHHAKKKKNGYGEYCLKGCKQSSVSHFELLSFASKVGGKGGEREGKLLLAAEEEKVTA